MSPQGNRIPGECETNYGTIAWFAGLPMVPLVSYYVAGTILDKFGDYLSQENLELPFFLGTFVTTVAGTLGYSWFLYRKASVLGRRHDEIIAERGKKSGLE